MDRGTKTTLALTIPSWNQSHLQRICLPRYLYFSFDSCGCHLWGVGRSCSVLLWSGSAARPAQVGNGARGTARHAGLAKPRPIVTHVNTGKARYYRLISMDSGLEAFSLNPTRGSFGALTLPSTPLPMTRTNGSSRAKLDYCRDNDLISRVKLTCLTTV